MGIILYQSAIAIIMIVCRVVAPGALVAVALALTAFTAFNVFWPPLLVFQLAVIWGLFALLRKAKAA